MLQLKFSKTEKRGENERNNVTQTERNGEVYF